MESNGGRPGSTHPAGHYGAGTAIPRHLAPLLAD